MNPEAKDKLEENFDPSLLNSLGIDVENIATDSRMVKPGDTFLAYVGEKVDARKFIPQAIEAGANAPDAHQGKKAIFSEVIGYTMVHDGRYKLTIDTATEEPVEMFDLETDPKELTNFVGDPDYGEIRKKLFDDYLITHRQRLDKSTLDDLKGVRSPQASGRLLGIFEKMRKETYH